MTKKRKNKNRRNAIGRKTRLGNNGETPDNEPQREMDHGELNNGTDNEVGMHNIVREDQEVNRTPVDYSQLSYPQLLMAAMNREFVEVQALLARIRNDPEEPSNNETSYSSTTEQSTSNRRNGRNKYKNARRS